MPTDKSASSASQIKQDVYEVDLLLDFMSGRPDKHIATLDKQIPDLSERQIIEIFYKSRNEILFNDEVNAYNTWFILKLKDILNTFVSPARGLTIAYTILFSIKYHSFPPNPSDRLIIAQNAFPGLIENAESFRRIKTVLSCTCLLVTLFAALLLAQAFYGEKLANRFITAKLEDTEAASHLYLALNDDSEIGKFPDLATYCQSGAEIAKGLSAQIRTMCDDLAYKHALLCAAIQDVGRFSTSAFFEAASFFLPSHEFGKIACASPPCSQSQAQQADAATLLNLVTVLSNYLLPLLFGISGSLTAFLRGLQEKVQDSVLAPRDAALSFIRLPLGIIAGITVGLFYNGGSSGNLATASLGTLTLSSAGIAFLAGYGSETFFMMLDDLINKVFRLREKTGGEKPPTGPTQSQQA